MEAYLKPCWNDCSKGKDKTYILPWTYKVDLCNKTKKHKSYALVAHRHRNQMFAKCHCLLSINTGEHFAP